MSGVNPHELPPLLVAQSVDEWIVIQTAVKSLCFSDCRDALLDDRLIFARTADGGTQTRQRWNAGHGPTIQDTARHPIADRSTKNPGHAKAQTDHFTFHRFGQMIARLSQIPTLQLGVAVDSQCLDLADHVIGRLEIKSSFRNAHFCPLGMFQPKFSPTKTNGGRQAK
jgi:hypothetical protein